MATQKPVWYHVGIGFSVAAIFGVAAAALHEIYKSSKESPEPVVDLFRAPTQPLIPHADVEAVAEEAKAQVETETPEEKVLPEETETPEEPEMPEEIEAPKEVIFIANKETKVFHTSDCQFGNRISDDKRIHLSNREKAIEEGYKPCGRCKP